MDIITSIFPSNKVSDMQNQREAIDSWRIAGMSVHSCNVLDEITRLSADFPDVDFIEPKRSGLEKFGKPFVYISDMLEMMREMSYERIGIINSDIRLRGVTSDMLDRLETESRDKLLFLHRYDIDSKDDKEGVYFFSGIDAFFLNSKNVDKFYDQGYAMGMPEWDHWMIYMAVQAGMTTLEIKDPIAYHIKHAQRWLPEQSSNAVFSAAYEINEYYNVTNRVMSDINLGIVLSSESDIDTERYNLNVKPGIYVDKDAERLLRKRARDFGYERVLASIGLCFMQNDIFYRVCALHGEFRKKYFDGCMIEKKVEEPSNIAASGMLVGYIDIKNTGLIERLGRFYVYPAGRGARLMLKCLTVNGLSPLGVIDRDPALHGRRCDDFEILPMTVLEGGDFDTVLLVSNLYGEEIYKQLSEIVDTGKIIMV